jgi:hypothetical protein
MVGTSNPHAPWLERLSQDHRDEINRYRLGHPFREDPECLAYARAISGGRDDTAPFCDPEDPADPLDDVRGIPERFRESFERLPEDLKMRVARRFRRLMALNAHMQAFRAKATPDQRERHNQLLEASEDIRERAIALMAEVLGDTATAGGGT